MEKRFDKYERRLAIGMSVIIDDPSAGDDWNHSFTGQVKDMDDKFRLTVEDGEGNRFEPRYSQIETDPYDTSALHFVDIPQCHHDGTPSDTWKNVTFFTTKEEAIAYAQEHFGADENGMVSLIA